VAACLRTLGFLEIDLREQDISAAVEHTCDWLFDTPQFKAWRNRTDLPTNNGVLCLKGKPGTGKSTLMKHTLEYWRDAFPNDIVIAYFFNARGGTLEKSPLGMLRSITYQLVKKDVTLFDQLLVRFRDKNINCQSREWEWQQRDLKAFIISEIKRWKLKPLLLLVDALDECNEAEIQDVLDFLERLSINAKTSGTTLRICLSRRHHPPLRIVKSLELIVENDEGHRKDIATYIKAKLAIRDAEIEDEIEEKAEGIFMWVVLVVRLLNKAWFKVRGKRKRMQDALEKIPGELEEVFRMLFNKDEEDMDETLLMLQWVLFAQRPLTPEELYAAVEAGDTGLWSQSSDTDHDSIQQSIEYLSKGLIEIRSGDAASATVQFIHLSVNDFLLRNKRLQTLDPALKPDPVTASHRRLWACCWSHIRQVNSTCTEGAYKELRSRYPFLWYAASHIFGHAEKVLNEGAVGQDGVEIVKWLRDGSSWFEWWKGFHNAIHLPHEYDDKYEYLKGNLDAGLLYMLSYLGYSSLVKCMLAGEGDGGAEDVEVNAHGGLYGNALHAASAEGHQQIVKLLLDQGAEVNAQGGLYGNALQAALVRGNRQIVKLLLDQGAEVNAQGGNYGNALQAASGSCDQQIVKLLLDQGAEVNAQGGYYGNALQAASGNGGQQLVKLLLDQGAEVNAQGGKYGNALQAGSWGGDQQIVKLLLNQGAEVNAQGGYYGNALQAASWRGDQQIVKLLLDQGAEVNAQGGEYGTALQAASEGQKQQIVELLLHHGADVNAQGGLYGNALQTASWKGDQQIMKLLLDQGAEVNAQGGYYGNALQAASLRGDQQFVKLLLDQGAEVNAQGGLYGNALQAGLWGEDQQIVELLLHQGAEVNAQGGLFGNALQAALVRGDQQLVKLLLDQGAEVNAQGGYYGNALQAASGRGNQELVKLLLDQGAEVNAQGGEYGTALQAASEGQHQQIVELLLDQGAEVNVQGGCYGNALQAASLRGNQQIVKLLLDRGAEVNEQGGKYGTALQATSLEGQ
jgi:ankyrin repeat protein